MLTTTELENYAIKEMNIPFVNFKGIDVRVINDILVTLKKAYKRYPLLTNCLVAIYQGEDFNNYENLMHCSVKEEWHRWQEFTKDYDNIIHYYQQSNETKLSTFVKVDHQTKIVDNLGIIIGDGFLNLDYLKLQSMCVEDCLNGLKTKHCRYFDSIVWHEIGHLLDSILHISYLEEFQKMLINVNIEREISLYATINYYETLAESFAEYIKASEANELEDGIIKKIGLLIDREYLRYAHNQGLRKLFDIKSNFPQARRRKKNGIIC